MALPSKLTTAEKSLLAAYPHGKPVVLAPTYDTPTRFWRAARQVRQAVIRHLLLSQDDVASGEIRKLDITGAYVVGPLDLRFADIDAPMRFANCHFDCPVTIAEAHLRSVAFDHCILPLIDARHLTVTGDMLLDGTHVTGSVLLPGARLSEDLHLRHAKVGIDENATRYGDGTATDGEAGAELDMANIEVTGNIEATGLQVRGQIKLCTARVNGNVTIDHAEIRPDAGRNVAWDGDGVVIRGQIEATGLGAEGQVRLVDADLLNLIFDEARLDNTDGAALVLDRMHCRGSAFFEKNAYFAGGIKAIGLKVGGGLYLKHAVATVINLRRATIASDLRCQYSSVGMLNINDAQISGELRVISQAAYATSEGRGASEETPMPPGRPDEQPERREALIDRATGRAARGDEVIGVLAFRPFIARSHTDVRQRNGTTGETTGASPSSTAHAEDAGASDEPSVLDGRGVHVSRRALVRTVGVVNLSDANVDGDLTLDLKRLRGPTRSEDVGAAADLTGAHAHVLTIEGAPRAGFLDLSNAVVGHLADNRSDSPIRLDGFVYESIAEPGHNGVHHRLSWVRAGVYGATKGDSRTHHWVSRWGADNRQCFKPQPYRQLASVYQKAGNDHDSRRVLYVMNCDHNATEPLGRWYSKTWGYLQDLFVGYGYVPIRALLWVIVLATLGLLWFVRYDPQHRISVIEAAILSLGLVLPGSGLDKIEAWKDMPGVGHLLAAVLLLTGLVLGATVIAAIARAVKR